MDSYAEIRLLKAGTIYGHTYQIQGKQMRELLHLAEASYQMSFSINLLRVHSSKDYCNLLFYIITIIREFTEANIIFRCFTEFVDIEQLIGGVFVYNLQIIEERIVSIAKEMGLSKNRLLINTNLNKSVFDNMKKGQIPSVDKIHTIADYLNCSVDYLLGRTDNPEVNK